MQPDLRAPSGMRFTDIIIPTLKPLGELTSLISAIEQSSIYGFRVIPTCLNASAAANRNHGLDRSSSDPVIMVDDDIERFPVGWARDLVTFMDTHPNCLMVSPELAKPTGGPSYMIGGAPRKVAGEGFSVAPEHRLPTACIAIRRNELRFDEGFIGSGFEDDDYCMQLHKKFPEGTFCVLHDVWVVHRHERKNQRGPNWVKNQALFKAKWQNAK